MSINGPRWMVRSPGGSPVNSRPVEEDHRFADGQFLGYLTDRCQGGRWQPVE